MNDCELLAVIDYNVFHVYAGISCIQFDETRIVSGSWDKTIKVLLLY